MKLPNSTVLSFGKKINKNVKDLLQAQALKWNFQKVMSAEIHSRLLRGGGSTFNDFMRIQRGIITPQNAKPR